MDLILRWAFVCFLFFQYGAPCSQHVYHRRTVLSLGVCRNQWLIIILFRLLHSQITNNQHAIARSRKFNSRLGRRAIRNYRCYQGNYGLKKKFARFEVMFCICTSVDVKIHQLISPFRQYNFIHSFHFRKIPGQNRRFGKLRLGWILVVVRRLHLRCIGTSQLVEQLWIGLQCTIVGW